MLTYNTVLIALNNALATQLVLQSGGAIPQLNFYTIGDVPLATIVYDSAVAQDTPDSRVVLLSGGSRQLFTTVYAEGEVAKFRIQYPVVPPIHTALEYLFQGSVGAIGHRADITFPSTYWPLNSTIMINELKLYVIAGTSN